MLYFLKLPLSFRFQREKFVNHILEEENYLSLGSSSETNEQVSVKISYNPQRMKAYHFQSWN